MAWVAVSRSSSVVGFFPRTRRAESPRPMPRSIRPRERICSTASVLAVTDGSRVAGFVTHVPSRNVVLFWAMRVRRTYGSFQRTWLSKTQPCVNPHCSASFVSETTRSSEWSGLSVKPNSIGRAVYLRVPLQGAFRGELDHEVAGELKVVVLRVLRREKDERLVALPAVLEHLRRSLDEDVRELAPVLAPAIDHDRGPAGRGDVAHAPQHRRALGLGVDRGVEDRRDPREAHRDDVRASIAARRPEVADPGGRQEVVGQERSRRSGRTRAA